MTHTTKNTARFYEGSYQFYVEKTNLNINEGFIQYVLAKQYEYRNTTESLWAEVEVDGIEYRYILDYPNNTLIQLK